jgi:ferredoxin
MPKITFLANGQVAEVAAGSTFLEYCQNNAAPHDFGCTVGSCGTCRLEIVAGADNVNPISEDERETIEMCTDNPNGRLGCQLVIQGDISIRPIE